MTVFLDMLNFPAGCITVLFSTDAVAPDQQENVPTLPFLVACCMGIQQRAVLIQPRGETGRFAISRSQPRHGKVPAVSHCRCHSQLLPISVRAILFEQGRCETESSQVAAVCDKVVISQICSSCAIRRSRPRTPVLRTSTRAERRSHAVPSPTAVGDVRCRSKAGRAGGNNQRDLLPRRRRADDAFGHISVEISFWPCRSGA